MEDSTGTSHFADGLPHWSDHFVCPGEAVVAVREGNYNYVIERGPEYLRLSGGVEVADAQSVTIKKYYFDIPI